MNTWEIVTLGALSLLVLWAIGANRRLTALRNVFQTQFQQYETCLTQQNLTLKVLVAAADAAPTWARQLTAASEQVCAAALVLRDRGHRIGPARGLMLAEETLNKALAAARTPMEELAADNLAMAPQIEALRALGRHLDVARQGYNASAASYNAAINQLPARLLAALAGLHRAGLLTPAHTDERDPQRVQS